MPPMPPVPQVLKILIGGFVDNTKVQNWANVFHVSYTGTAPNETQLTTLATTINGQWVTHIASLCPAPTTLTTVQITDLTSITSAGVNLEGSQAGTRGDDSGPANAAVLVSYPVPARWRGGHPRTYLYVGGVADYTGAAQWNINFQFEAQSKWIAFLSAFIPSAVGATQISSLVVVRAHGKSLPNGGPPRYVLNTPIVYPINHQLAVTSAEMASQRGRIGRAKRNKAGAVP